MTTQVIQRKWWQFLKDALNGTPEMPERRECYRRVTILDSEALTLPAEVSEIRVVRGGAWVSHLREDIVLYGGQTLQLQPDNFTVVVTALGREALELEMYR